MLHVLWFVHTYGQFDLQILVRARLGHCHLMELWLLGAVRSWVEDDLHSDKIEDSTAGLSRSWIFGLGSCSAALLVYLCELAISIYLTVFESGKERARDIAGLCSASPKRKPNLSLLSREEASFPANVAAVGDQRALSQAKVNTTTGTFVRNAELHHLSQ